MRGGGTLGLGAPNSDTPVVRLAVSLLIGSLGLVPSCALPARFAFPENVEPGRVEASLPDGVVRFEALSPALSRFFGRPAAMDAWLALPPAFRPEERMPVCYHLPDLGEDPLALCAAQAAYMRDSGDAPRIVLVVLDPRGIHGHHLFADSVNEGPRGEALLADLIPQLERSLLAQGTPPYRFISGRGLGAWGAVRLQVTSAHAFDGCWAIEPDPLDMRRFYGSDLESAESLYRTRDGEPARLTGRRVAYLVDEADLDARLEGFETALGPRGDDGRPMQLIDRRTGALQRLVVDSFRRADPGALLIRRGSVLQPRLDGKLNLFAGDGDCYGRDESLRLFGLELQRLLVRALVRIRPEIEGEPELRAAWREMAARPLP